MYRKVKIQYIKLFSHEPIEIKLLIWCPINISYKTGTLSNIKIRIFRVMYYYHMVPRFHSSLADCSSTPFTTKELYSVLQIRLYVLHPVYYMYYTLFRITYCCHASSFSLGQFLRFYLTFMTGNLQTIISQTISQNLGLSSISSWLESDYVPLAGILQKWRVFLSFHLVKWDMVSIYPTMGVMVSVTLLYHEVIFYTLLLTNIWDIHWDDVNTSYLIKPSSTSFSTY